MSERGGLKDLENAFQEIQKLLGSDDLKNQKSISAHHLDPEGYELQMVYKVRALGVSMESTYSYPERGRPSVYAVRDKIHLRPHSLEQMRGKISDSVLETLKAFFKEQIPKAESFQAEKFPGTDHLKDRQLLMICYSQSSGEHSFELQSYGSRTFGDMHEDETLFSFHFGETSKELEIFDYDKGDWLEKSPTIKTPVVLFGQSAWDFTIRPTPHRLIAKQPDPRRYSFILETLSDEMAPAEVEAGKRSLSRKVMEKTAFLIWEEEFNNRDLSNELSRVVKKACFVHGFFVAPEIHKKVFEGGRQQIRRLEEMGFEKIVILNPGLILRGENEIKQLLNLSERFPHKFLFFYQPWHNLENLLVMNIGNGKAEVIEKHLEGRRVSDLKKTLPSEPIVERDPFLNSSEQALGDINPDFIKAYESELDVSLKKGFDRIFLYNTEGYQDVDDLDKNIEFSRVTGLASGFKTWYLASRFIDSVRYIRILDFNEESVELHRLLHQQWDGHDLPGFLKEKGFCHNQFFQYTEEYEYDLWNKELERWGGAKNFADSWRLLKQIKVEFEVVDLLASEDFHWAKTDEPRSSVFWFSNIWNNEFAATRFGENLVEELAGWVSQIARVNGDCILLMDHQMHNGEWLKFSGKTAEQVVRELGVDGSI